MLTGAIVIMKTEAEWLKCGFKVFSKYLIKDEKDKLYNTSEVCNNLQVCNKCDCEYNGNYVYLYDLMKIANPKLVEDYDNTCRECLEHYLRDNDLDVERLLDMIY